MIDHPTFIYVNWSAYDELSDTVELTEQIAMKQLGEMLRLRRLGARLDYYLMDAFWFAKDGGYRTWRKPHWPDGPDRWLDGCLSNGITPGLWLSTNAASQKIIDPVPAWQDSLDESGRRMCCFQGNFLTHLIETMNLWHDRGVKLFKFDFADLNAATPAAARTMLPSEIRAANITALSAALQTFRHNHPDTLLIAYNGFEEQHAQDGTSKPIRRSIDSRWLEVFDTLYCGDPRPADVPAMRFWRSKDIYSDHMVRVYQHNFFPLPRIDNAGFMIGTTGTCYGRGAEAWKGMLLLSLARGGWANTYYGDLSLLSDHDAAWFAKAQEMFLPFQSNQRCAAFGSIPGEAKPYGWTAMNGDGLITIVNPSQSQATIEIPIPKNIPAKILFSDAGFLPQLNTNQIILGPEQMALIGIGRYAESQHDLGKQNDVIIPKSIVPLDITFEKDGEKSLVGNLTPPAGKHLRIILKQLRDNGAAMRTSGGSYAGGTSLGKMLRITATQGDKPLPITIEYDRPIWSGLSWAAGEIAPESIKQGTPLAIRLDTTEKSPVKLLAQIYAVEY